uniref:Chromosome partition protein Smc n=1 Tax=Mesocestoides corti TaxID=53468 RepID=A0A5K3G1B8_MESCO
MRPDLLNQVENLERDLNRLDDRIRREGQRELDEFSRRLEASGNRDSTLTEQARNATETIRNLKEEAAEVRGTVQDIDTILRSLEFDAEALAQSTRRAFDKLNSQLKRLKDVMATQKEALKSEIDHVQRLTMDQRQRLAKLNEAIENAPDVGAEQSKLEGILRDWNDALSR